MQKITAKQVGYSRASLTDATNNAHKPINLQNSKNAKLINQYGVCIICGQVSEGLLKCHAAKHGYTPQEMADRELYKAIK